MERLAKAGRFADLRNWLPRVPRESFSPKALARAQDMLAFAELALGERAAAQRRWQRLRKELAATGAVAEDAAWGMALARVLDAPATDGSLRRALLELQVAYQSGAGHAVVSDRVLAVLDRVQDEELRKELKNLSRRAWERESAFMRETIDAALTGAMDGAGHTAAERRLDSLARANPAWEAEIRAARSRLGNPGGAQVTDSSGETTPTAVDAAAIRQRIDSLLAGGHVAAAVFEMDALPGGSGIDSVARIRAKLGERFCEEKRREAATAFKSAQARTAATGKAEHLAAAGAQLDSCLALFPKASEAAKARRNRETVAAELQKLRNPPSGGTTAEPTGARGTQASPGAGEGSVGGARPSAGRP